MLQQGVRDNGGHHAVDQVRDELCGVDEHRGPHCGGEGGHVQHAEKLDGDDDDDPAHVG